MFLVADHLAEGGATTVAAYLAVVFAFLFVFSVSAAFYYYRRSEAATDAAEEAIFRVNAASDIVVDARAALLTAQATIHELERRLADADGRRPHPGIDS